MNKKEELRELLGSMSRKILEISRLIEQDTAETDTEEQALKDGYWYKYGANQEDNYLIYKTSPTKGFGWNKIGKWVHDAGWNYTFNSEPETWQVALDSDVVKCLTHHANQLYSDAIMIDQSGVGDSEYSEHSIPTSINPHDEISVSYDKKSADSGEDCKVMIGLKLVFSTKTGQWAKPITQRDIVLNFNTWYQHKEQPKRLILRGQDGVFVGFNENGKYCHNLGSTIDNSQQKWVKATQSEIRKIFRRHTENAYPKGRNWIQINTELNLYETDHSKIDIEIYSGGNVVVWLDELKLFDLYKEGTWPKRMEIEKPVIDGHEMTYINNDDGKFIMFGEDKLPLSWFVITHNCGISQINLTNDMVIGTKEIQHINLYLQTQGLI